MRRWKGLMLAAVMCILGGLISENASAQTLDKKVITEEKSVQDYSGFEVSEAMTAQEIAEVYAEDFEITVEEAANNLGINLNARGTSRATKYRTLGASIDVTSEYKPTAKFYCQTSESGNNWGIVALLDVSMNRNYNGLEKQFQGSVYANLENAYTIYYRVDGDFYNAGTTTVSSSGSVGAGGTGITYSVSSSSSLYKVVYYENRLVTAK